MSVRSSRREFLLGITLNELAFLLFFLLILVTALTLKKKESEITTQEDIISKQEDELKTRLIQIEQQKSVLEKNFKRLEYQEKVISRFTGLGPNAEQEEYDEVFKKLVDIEQLSEQMERLTEENKSLERKNSQLQEYKAVIGKLEQEGITGSPNDISQQCVAAVSGSKQLEGRLAWTKARLEKCAGKGLDHPPCWSDKNGKPEYIYRITIHEADLNIEGIWSKHRNIDVQTIPNVESLSNRRISIAEFIKLAAPIKIWSIQHNCRHHVRIYVEETTSMSAFRHNLLTVEDIFYKWLSPG